jgi:hypothetical protein
VELRFRRMAEAARSHPIARTVVAPSPHRPQEGALGTPADLATRVQDQAKMLETTGRFSSCQASKPPMTFTTPRKPARLRKLQAIMLR